MFGNGAHSRLDDILRLTRAFITGTHGLLAPFALVAQPCLWDVYNYSVVSRSNWIIVQFEGLKMFNMFVSKHRRLYSIDSIGIPKYTLR